MNECICLLRALPQSCYSTRIPFCSPTENVHLSRNAVFFVLKNPIFACVAHCKATHFHISLFSYYVSFFSIFPSLSLCLFFHLYVRPTILHHLWTILCGGGVGCTTFFFIVAAHTRFITKSAGQSNKWCIRKPIEFNISGFVV